MVALAQQFDTEARRAYIGASEVAAVMGLDRYRTPLDVWNEKTGRTPGFEGNKHTERGNRLEAIAADVYTEITGFKVRRHNSGFMHPKFTFIQGHVDRMIVGEKRILEIKAPSMGAFRKHQREGLPESYLIQAQMYMGLSGCPKLTYAIFCADAWELASFDIDFDPDLYNIAIQSVQTFWDRHVLPGLPPCQDDDSKPAVDVGKVGGSAVMVESESPVHRAMLELAEAKQLMADAKTLEDLAKKSFKSAVENAHGVYIIDGITVHFQPTAGKTTFDKKKLAAAHPEIDLSVFEKTGQPGDRLTVYTKGE